MIAPGRMQPSYKMRGGQPTPKIPAQLYSFAAPRRGWVLDENRLQAQPGAAQVLDNWFPTTSGIRVRGGANRYATIVGAAKSLFTYKSATTEKLFACTNRRVYDISTISDPTAVYETSEVGSRSSGDYITTQFGTAGGDYLYAVNGADEPLLYDGATFTAITGVSVPAITGIDPNTFSHVWSYANRLFFIEKNSMSAWYLPVDSIGGAAQEFSLAGVFTKGGYLLAGTRWSLDTGDGLDDKCVFISSQGEVAIYQGGNPSSASDWFKVGLYDITEPLGPKAILQAGGDVIIATKTGLVPISQAVSRDVAVLGAGAISKPIAPYWQSKASTLIGGWDVARVSGSGALYVTQPGDNSMLVVNTTTGAWSRYTGWNARAITVFQGVGYFADNVNGVFIMEDGGSDDGEPYTARYLGLHEMMGVGMARKTVSQMRYALTSSVALNPLLSVSVDFGDEASTAPATGADGVTPMWNVTNWDEAYWDGGAPEIVVSGWQSIGKSGFVVAPELALTFDIQITPDVELMAIDATFHVGAVVA